MTNCDSFIHSIAMGDGETQNTDIVMIPRVFMLYCAMFVSGLMGNFNGEKSDDFSLPDGTNVGNASAFTEQEIYDFGRNCKITIYSISITHMKKQWSATLYQYITDKRIGCIWLKQFFFSNANELPIRFNHMLPICFYHT